MKVNVIHGAYVSRLVQVRLLVSFSPEAAYTTLPVHYNHFLQGCLYHCLGDDAQFYHDLGYRYQKECSARFPSRLLGRSTYDR